MLIRLGAYCLFLLALAPATVSADSVQDLSTLLDRFLAGASVNDAAMHDRFWSQDLIYTSSSGERYGKAQIMQGLAQAPAVAEASAVYSAEDVRIQQPAKDVAVVTFRLVNTPATGARQFYFNTGVFERRDGQWRASVWQATSVPPASP